METFYGYKQCSLRCALQLQTWTRQWISHQILYYLAQIRWQCMGLWKIFHANAKGNVRYIQGSLSFQYVSGLLDHWPPEYASW